MEIKVFDIIEIHRMFLVIEDAYKTLAKQYKISDEIYSQYHPKTTLVLYHQRPVL